MRNKIVKLVKKSLMVNNFLTIKVFSVNLGTPNNRLFLHNHNPPDY